MGVDLIPEPLRARFRFDERNHATAVLASDFPNEFADILACLSAFTLKRSQITVGGGGRSAIPIAIDGFLESRGWAEKKFDIEITADGNPIPIPTHKIDNFKNRVGVEVEWNNRQSLMTVTSSRRHELTADAGPVYLSLSSSSASA